VTHPKSLDKEFEIMFNHLLLTKLGRLLARHWLVALCIAGVAGILWMGAPAWAAPVARPLNQTVPRPTPTSEGDPVATATPSPDDDGDGSSEETGGDPSEDGSDNGSGSEPSADDPNIVFEPGAVEADDNPVASLTAAANVDGLNVREGPGTNFNIVGSLPTATQVDVLSRNEDGSWWFICCVPNTEATGWVSAQLLTPDFDGAEAVTLLPLFGTEPEIAPQATITPTAIATAQALPQAEQTLAVDFKIDPYFVWQGITTTLTITINNPNTVDAMGVLLSDELPESLRLIDASADAGGTVETVTTANGRPLLLFRWESIPADSAVSVTIVAQIDPDLPDGAVIDNLVATRARNVAYSTDAVTIGMPPVAPPSFE
jgi:uncharacterized repeat protein (TIGR01451 family)